MRVKTIVEKSDSISGVSRKTNNAYWALKVHDIDAHDYVMLFVDEETFNRYKAIPSGSPVEVVLDIKLGTKYYTLVSMEVEEI